MDVSVFCKNMDEITTNSDGSTEIQWVMKTVLLHNVSECDGHWDKLQPIVLQP